MTSDRRLRIEELYQSVQKLEPSQRVAFLEEACAGDEALRREIETLLVQRMAEKPAPSMVGRQIGVYEIVSLLGAGGMGEVYKAHDSRLNRSVAIKVLPPDKTSNAERKRRFVQEARAASALNHPNIVTIHDIGSESGIDFVVMEHVTGKTLEQLIPRQGLKLNEALKYSIQLADALANAHSAGIIHRDLKPGNIMVTSDGLVKVLDFGLAKLTESEPVGEEGTTQTLRPSTEEGTIAGTVVYMSPEQAEGKAVDARSDIFSFGSVLYEMVTGQRAFQGDSKISTLAAILNKEPKPVSELNRVMPRELEKIIRRCLRKDPARRFQDMDDLKVALQELKEESDSGTLTGVQSGVRSSRRNWIWATTVVVVGLAIAGWFLRGIGRKSMAPLEVVPLTSYAGDAWLPSFSPDGNQVVFSWNGEKEDNFDIYIKLIGSPTLLRLTRDPAGDYSPAFSPDGRHIGFVRATRERASFIIVPSIGGPERSVAELPALNLNTNSTRFAWFPDGKWVVIFGLALLSTETGEIRSLTFPQNKLFVDDAPAVSPDGRTVAFIRAANNWFDSNIFLLDLTDDLKPKREPRQLTFLKGFNSDPVWTANGQEIIFSSGAFGSSSLWKISASGARGPERLPFGIDGYSLAISRSGSRLAYERRVRDDNIWRLPLSGSGVTGGPPARFIFSTLRDYTPQYSLDGKHIAFASDRTGVLGIWVSDADGSNPVELFSHAGTGSPSWSPDGQRIAFGSNLEGNDDIYVIRANGGKPTRLTTDPAEDVVPSWSQDGNWIYFASTRRGRYEVWKAPSGGGEAIQVTRNGGFAALESLDGKTVYYTKGAPEQSMALWRVPVNGGEETQVLPSVVWRAFALVEDGIYFIPDPDANGEYSVQFLPFGIGKVKTVAPIPSRPSRGLTASADRRYLLYTQWDEARCDLMLVENFR